MRFSRNGNIGIGTNAPNTAKLVIGGTPTSQGIDLSTSDVYANLRVIQNTNSTFDKDLYIGYNSGATSALHLFSNNVEVMTVRNSRVGIFSVDPHGLLQFVNGNLNRKIVLNETADNDHEFVGFGVTNGLRFQLATTGASYQFYAATSSTTSNELMRLTGGGNLYLGTASGLARLVVRQDLQSVYAATFQNLGNTAGDNRGVAIFGGQNTYSVGQNLLTFFRPDNAQLGGVFQNSTSTIAYATSSDERLKNQIKDTRFGLKTVLNIDVKDYFYKDDQKTLHTGFIAQQLYQQYPLAVVKGGDDEKTNPWMVDYSKLTPVLVKAIQEQQQQVDALKKENQQLRAEIDWIKEQISGRK
jgi:hypothetical protein